METIPYRNSKLLLKTIPKDTLLFRLVLNSTDDLRGVRLEDGTRCLTPNYNVYFYPDPFTGKLTVGQFKDIKKALTEIKVYILTKDVKVLDLINDPKYSRSTKNSKTMFIKRCSTVKKGCLPRSQNSYDACLSKTIIEKYPDVVGMLALTVGDSAKLRKTMKQSKGVKYIRLKKDGRGISGVPEIVLHPLVKRPSKEMIIQETDNLENNYKLLLTIPLQDDLLLQFMKDHAEYDSATGFYKYY